jgi:transposase
MVTTATTNAWHRAWVKEGKKGLLAKGRSGAPPKLDRNDLHRIEALLVKGPQAQGYASELWTLERIATLIRKTTQVSYHPGHVWKILRNLGWSVQKPETRARERDERRIGQWMREVFPRIQKKGLRIGADIGFLDETGFSDRPTVRRTWSKRGETPIIATAGGWKNRTVIGTVVTNPRGTRSPALYAMIRQSSVHAEDCIAYLTYLKRHLHGKKLILLWDGLSAHTARVTQAFIATQRSWLTVERMPTYAPELNPPEYLWSSMKTKDCSNTTSSTLLDLDGHIKRSIARVRRSASLLRGCLRASGLFRY